MQWVPDSPRNFKKLSRLSWAPVPGAQQLVPARWVGLPRSGAVHTNYAFPKGTRFVALGPGCVKRAWGLAQVGPLAAEEGAVKRTS